MPGQGVGVTPKILLTVIFDTPAKLDSSLTPLVEAQL